MLLSNAVSNLHEYIFIVLHFNILYSLGSLASCIQNAEHIETSFVKDLCKSNPDLEEFMIAADILIRSDCALIDSCRRVVEQPQDDLDEVDFIVVGGGVAGKLVFIEKNLI